MTSEDGPRQRLSITETYDAFARGVAGTVTGCDVVRATGRDALSYLQSQCTQDLASLAVGSSAESLLLSPQGRIDAYVRVARPGAEEALVVVAAGYGEVVVARLKRFRLRVQVELEQLDWQCVQLRGPGAAELAEERAPDTVALAASWPGAAGVDLVGAGARIPASVAEGDPAAFEALRIESGQPALGTEITERSIAHEVGLTERTVSFTKGCFPGQELVARIDARGANVPRRLRGVVVAAEEVVRLPAELRLDGRTVGELTSVAWSPRLAASVGLASVRREVVPPAMLTLVPLEPGAPSPDASWSGGYPAEVRELPITGG